MTSWQVLVGDCREVLRTLPEQSVHCVVTSPPYLGLRDYGHDDQIGLEDTPEEYVGSLVKVFDEVWRVLRDDGTAWLNLGDSFATRWSSRRTDGGRAGFGPGENRARHHAAPAGFKSKDLMMIPARVAIALQERGWYLRSEVIWSKPNPMPESVTDRPTRAHEQVFLLSKRPSYFYDHRAISEPAVGTNHHDLTGTARTGIPGQTDHTGNRRTKNRTVRPGIDETRRNKRSVWTVPTRPYAEAHFATFPPDLVEPCVLAGAPRQACAACGAPWVAVIEKDPSGWPERKAAGATWGNVENPAANGGTARVVHGEGVSRDLTRPSRRIGEEPSCECGADSVPGVVLDPFNGAGTTGLVAVRAGRAYVGIELNGSYAALSRERIATDIRLGHRPPTRAADPVEGQMSMLGEAGLCRTPTPHGSQGSSMGKAHSRSGVTETPDTRASRLA